MALCVIFDGSCGRCRSSVKWIGRMDWFRRCRYLDYHEDEREACSLTGESRHALDEALHVVDGHGPVLAGFLAVRRLLWVNPLAWPFAALLHLPGMDRAGQALYARLAANRHRAN